MRVCRPALISLALLFAAWVAHGQGTIYTLRTNGPMANRINLVFLAEGYTSGQTANFTNDARAALQQLEDTPPYATYKSYLNAFAIFVASAESGSDHPSNSVYRDTYFNSSYDSYGTAYILTFPPNDRDHNYANGRGRVDALLQSLRPDYDIALLLVNDPAYGGSGGPVSVASTHPLSGDIAIHEIGHSFAGLGDEYTNAYPGFPDIEEPNTTRETDRAQIKWNAWILASTPVPTPDTAAYQTAVGLFEGAHYHTTGWYRPRRDCKMRTLSNSFCEVCRETIAKSIYDVIDPVDSVSPPTNVLVSVTDTGPVNFATTLLQPSTHSLLIQWWVNDVPRLGATSASLSLSAPDLAPGTNTVRIEVADGTALVRNDPQGLLHGSRSWTVLLPPRVAINRTNNRVAITWPPDASGYLLQSKPDLNPATAWTTVMVITDPSGAEFDLTNSACFFRLQWPK